MLGPLWIGCPISTWGNICKRGVVDQRVERGIARRHLPHVLAVRHRERSHVRLVPLPEPRADAHAERRDAERVEHQAQDRGQARRRRALSIVVSGGGVADEEAGRRR